jgi:hypothetical protein
MSVKTVNVWLPCCDESMKQDLHDDFMMKYTIFIIDVSFHILNNNIYMTFIHNKGTNLKIPKLFMNVFLNVYFLYINDLYYIINLYTCVACKEKKRGQ